MLSSQIANLGCLCGGELLGVVEVCVDELLVLEIDEWAEEEEGVEDEGEAPEWDPLDQPVGDEGGGESLRANVSCVLMLNFSQMNSPEEWPRCSRQRQFAASQSRRS
jgi:hypothetical protein